MPNNTLLTSLFKDVSKLFQSAAAGNLKGRAATVGEIWSYIQEQLEADYALENPDAQTVHTDEFGNSWSMCPSYVLDVYLNDKGAFALVTKSDGKLYKVPVTVGKDNVITTGEYIEVFMEALPVVGRQVSIKRQSDGKVRWFAMPACTAVLNRSGEIDSTKLFDSFVEHIMRTEEYPILDFYHLGEAIPLGQTDWVGRDGVAYCASGLFDDSDIARAAIKSLEENPEYWGLSIAYLPTSEPSVIRSADGVGINVYNTGINRFISLLPENEAASILTSISTQDEVTRMNAKVKEALKRLAGGDEELVQSFELKVDGVNRNATTMISRDALTPAVTPAPATAPVVPVVPLTEPAAVEARAISSEDLTALLADPAFEARVKEIIAAQAATQAQADLDAANATLQTESRKEFSLLRQAINGLTLKMNAIEKARGAEQQIIEDDMPANSKTRVSTIVRPRATIKPSMLKRENVDMAAIADQTLAKIEA